MFIVQCNLTAPARERPLAPPSAWRIPPVEDTIESVANDLLEGEYSNPVRVIGFDSADRTSRDLTADVARGAAATLRGSAARATGIPARISGTLAAMITEVRTRWTELLELEELLPQLRARPQTPARSGQARHLNFDWFIP